MSIALGRLQRREDALELREELVEYIEKHLDDDFLLGRTYANLASSYGTLKRYDEALASASEVMKIAERIDHDRLRESAYSTIGNCHFEMGNQNESIKWFMKCFQVATKRNMPNAQIFSLRKVASIYIDQVN